MAPVSRIIFLLLGQCHRIHLQFCVFVLGCDSSRRKWNATFLFPDWYQSLGWFHCFRLLNRSDPYAWACIMLLNPSFICLDIPVRGKTDVSACIVWVSSVFSISIAGIARWKNKQKHLQGAHCGRVLWSESWTGPRFWDGSFEQNSKVYQDESHWQGKFMWKNKCILCRRCRVLLLCVWDYALA